MSEATVILPTYNERDNIALLIEDVASGTRAFSAPGLQPASPAIPAALPSAERCIDCQIHFERGHRGH